MYYENLLQKFLGCIFSKKILSGCCNAVIRLKRKQRRILLLINYFEFLPMTKLKQQNNKNGNIEKRFIHRNYWESSIPIYYAV